MSECRVPQPAEESSRPSPQPRGSLRVLAGERDAAQSSGEPNGHGASGHGAGFLALVDRVRRDARLASRYGLLGRFDVPDDPDRGAELFEALVFQDTSALNASGWLDRVEAIVRQEARLAALKAEAIAEFDAALHGVSADLGHRYPEQGDRAAEPGERRWVAGDLRSVADELALALQLHKGAATLRIHTSCELVRNFPATLRALQEGELTERAAFTIVRELSVLENLEDIRAAETAVLEWARKHPLAGIRREAQRAAARQSPAARSRAHSRAMEERSVRMFPTSDGTADLVHTQDAIDAAAVMASLNRAAARRRRYGDPRSLDQLRADIALARLLPRTRTISPDFEPGGGSSAALGAQATSNTGADAVAKQKAGSGDRSVDGVGLGPNHGADVSGTAAETDAADEAAIGADATVVIHATGAELRALLDGGPGTGGEADHHGPIPQSSLRKHLIRTLANSLLTNLPDACGHRGPRCAGRGSGISQAAPARFDVRITDEPPAGQPDTYTPTAAVDRYVRLRDRTCQFPGCQRPAEFADVDHRTAFGDGGRTTTRNLHCLCRHHHRLKHQGGWLVTPDADGTTTWTSPTGRRYRTPRSDDDEPPPPRSGEATTSPPVEQAAGF